MLLNKQSPLGFSVLDYNLLLVYPQKFITISLVSKQTTSFQAIYDAIYEASTQNELMLPNCSDVNAYALVGCTSGDRKLCLFFSDYCCVLVGADESDDIIQDFCKNLQFD